MGALQELIVHRGYVSIFIISQLDTRPDTF